MNELFMKTRSRARVVCLSRVVSMSCVIGAQAYLASSIVAQGLFMDSSMRADSDEVADAHGDGMTECKTPRNARND
jgi:hypothetical protein